MVVQNVEQLVSLSLEKDFNIWIHPFNGILLYYKNDGKLTVHFKIALINQLPPDFIIELPFGLVTCLSFSW